MRGQSDVVPDESIPSMLQRLSVISGEGYHVCVQCRTPYVTSGSYKHDELCIDCSNARHSYDRERRMG